MKYRITNITRKPGHKKGSFKQGFFVDVKPGGVVRPMRQGEHVDVDEITPGILAMQKKEYISIEPIKDLDIQIKKQIASNEAKTRANLEAATNKEIKDKEVDLDAAKLAAAEARKPVKQTATPVSGLDKDSMREGARLATETKATISGGEESEEESSMDPLGDIEQAVNPDGEPNFVVKAGKRNRNSRRN